MSEDVTWRNNFQWTVISFIPSKLCYRASKKTKTRCYTQKTVSLLPGVKREVFCHFLLWLLLLYRRISDIMQHLDHIFFILPRQYYIYRAADYCITFYSIFASTSTAKFFIFLSLKIFLSPIWKFCLLKRIKKKQNSKFRAVDVLEKGLNNVIEKVSALYLQNWKKPYIGFLKIVFF